MSAACLPAAANVHQHRLSANAVLPARPEEGDCSYVSGKKSLVAQQLRTNMRVDIIVSVAASRNATFRRMRSRNGAGELVLTLASPSWHQRHDSRHKCPCPLGREICESLQTAIPQGQFPGARRLLPALIPSMTAPSPRWLHQHLAVRPQLHRRFPPAQVPASEPANQRSSSRVAEAAFTKPGGTAPRPQIRWNDSVRSPSALSPLSTSTCAIPFPD